MKKNLFLLLFLHNISLVLGQQIAVQCSDGALFVNEDIVQILPGLTIGPNNSKKIIFPRYYVKDDAYVECDWVPTMTHIKELIIFSMLDDYREIKRRFPLKTFAELCVIYHDCGYLCMNDKSAIEESLMRRFYREQNVKKEHWTFMIQYFSSKKPNPFFDFTKSKSPIRDTMIAYWSSKMNQYKEKYMFCSHENDTSFYIFNDDICEKLVIKINKFYHFFNDEFGAFKRKICNGVLDLSNFQLTDDVLYADTKSGLNEFLFEDVIRAYPVKFKAKKIILDDNQITRFPLETWIKCFPNVEVISVKGCPINQPLSENDYALFNCKRSDYLIIIPPGTMVCEGMRQYYNRTTLMWNGRDALVEGYDYKNDTNPLTIITEDPHLASYYQGIGEDKLIVNYDNNRCVTKQARQFLGVIILRLLSCEIIKNKAIQNLYNVYCMKDENNFISATEKKENENSKSSSDVEQLKNQTRKIYFFVPPVILFCLSNIAKITDFLYSIFT